MQKIQKSLLLLFLAAAAMLPQTASAALTVPAEITEFSTLLVGFFGSVLLIAIGVRVGPMAFNVVRKLLASIAGIRG